MKCPTCFTYFSKDDYTEHRLAHIRLSLNSKQKTYEHKWLSKSNGRHGPNEACNCTFYGIRNYCEVLRQEAA